MAPLAATKTEQAYWALRRAIVIGELHEESALDEAELMARFGIGRTPTREAIKRLALEEFVVWPPHRTPYVRATTANELGQLYEARHFFEIPATRLAAERAADSEVEALEQHCDLFDKAASAEDMYEVAEQDYNFHLGIASASHNRFLVDAVGHLNCGSLRLWYNSYVQLGIERINADHRRTLDAIRRRHPDDAAAAGRDHIQFSQERQLRLFGLTSLNGDSTQGGSAPAGSGRRRRGAGGRR